MSNQSHESLTISADKKFLLDSKGAKVRQYVEPLKSFGPMSAKSKDGVEFDPPVMETKGQTFQGFHIRPCNFHKECIAWDSDGKCVQSVTTHDICYDDD